LSGGQALERHPELKSRLDEPVKNYSFGATLLIAAVQRTNREMIDLLLRAGADINARSHWWAELRPSWTMIAGWAVPDRNAARFEMRMRPPDSHAGQAEGTHLRQPAVGACARGDGPNPAPFAVTVEIGGLSTRPWRGDRRAGHRS